MKRGAIIKLLASFGLTFCAATGSLFTTRGAISEGHAHLNKPFFTPPDRLFGPL